MPDLSTGVTHLRPFWWAYAAASVVQAALVVGTPVGRRFLFTMWPSTGGHDPTPLYVIAALGVVQMVALVVLYRQPPLKPLRGEPTLAGSVLVALALLALLFNPYSLFVLTVLSIGLLPLGWVFGLPLAVLASTFSDVVLGRPPHAGAA